MSYTTTSECIGCERCLPACPTEAIQTNGSAVWIDIDRCNQCEGSHGVPQCWSICPTNEGCVPLLAGNTAVSLTSDSEHLADYWTSWLAKYTRTIGRLKATQPSGYWQHWFDTYSRALSNLQVRSSAEACL